MTQYARGRQFEYDVRDDLIAHGYYVMRSAGSKGVLDLIAMGHGKVLALQLKITDPLLPPANRELLLNTALMGCATPLVAHKYKDPRSKRVAIHYRRLTGQGPREWVTWSPGEDE